MTVHQPQLSVVSALYDLQRDLLALNVENQEGHLAGVNVCFKSGISLDPEAASHLGMDVPEIINEILRQLNAETKDDDDIPYVDAANRLVEKNQKAKSKVTKADVLEKVWRNLLTGYMNVRRYDQSHLDSISKLNSCGERADHLRIQITDRPGAEPRFFRIDATECDENGNPFRS